MEIYQNKIIQWDLESTSMDAIVKINWTSVYRFVKVNPALLSNVMPFFSGILFTQFKHKLDKE